ncbi:MAG: tRNA(Ile)(2)-agmatinylcytidine synthase [Aigarchaeota archaeon]|nr:tRNA(Ile)(2)-agmatinylcytidine synthase [Aigarchaeota archaeon]MCX8193249.1 tRNA(Ile)(2)-agmatinylcytidine synthase [Nitrososphaeria archaeon]MDW7986888.1 tRNA(Ile)(2)-agmatinylcytidine synthase [Nitrososphaerota archaeon]
MDKVVWIGIDDTDSKKAGCTTFVGALLLRRVKSLGYTLVGYPRLVRLNPNCPYKTRGNAAIALAVESDRFDVLEDVVIKTVEEYAELDAEGTDPGVAFFFGEPLQELREYYWHTVRELSSIEEAEKIAENIGAKLLKWKSGRGVIGALSAIGADLTKGRTYELIAYRRRDYWGTVRLVDPDSVWEMDKTTYPLTFDNVDRDTGEIRITPHTPCPVLLGIRGVTPHIVEQAYNMLRIYEPVEFYTIFETNQGTDAHLQMMKISNVKEGVSAIIDCTVRSKPRYSIGGHVFFKIGDETGEITCAVYEPTKRLRHIIVELEPGDEITVYGGVKMKPEGLTLNLEKIHIRSLVKSFVKRAPRCRFCGRKMKRVGKPGYVCKSCRSFSREPELVEVERKIPLGVYEVPPSARRHLSRPLALATNYQHG